MNTCLDLVKKNVWYPFLFPYAPKVRKMHTIIRPTIGNKVVRFIANDVEQTDRADIK